MIRCRAPTLLLHHEYSGHTCAATHYIDQYTVQSTKPGTVSKKPIRLVHSEQDVHKCAGSMTNLVLLAALLRTLGLGCVCVLMSWS